LSIAYANGHSHCDCYGNCDFHTYPGGITNTYTHNHRYSYAGGIADGYAYSNCHGDSYCYSNCHSHAHCNCERYTNIHTYRDAASPDSAASRDSAATVTAASRDPAASSNAATALRPLLQALSQPVATPVWGLCTFGPARSGRRTRLRVASAWQAAPWLQRVRIYKTASTVMTC
jgi:hypothetical protein